MSRLSSQENQSSVSKKLQLLPSLSISLRKPDFQTSLSQSGSQVTSCKNHQRMRSIFKPNDSIASNCHHLTNENSQALFMHKEELGVDNRIVVKSPERKAHLFPLETAESKSKHSLQFGVSQPIPNSYKWSTPKRQMDYSLGKAQIMRMETVSNGPSSGKMYNAKKEPQSRSSFSPMSSVTLTHLHSELTKHFSVAAQPILAESLTDYLDDSPVRKFETVFEGNQSHILPLSPNNTLEFELLQLPKRVDTIKKCVTAIKKTQQEATDSLFKIRSCQEQLIKKFTKTKEKHPNSQLETKHKIDSLECS